MLGRSERARRSRRIIERFTARVPNIGYWDLGCSVLGFGLGGVLAVMFNSMFFHLPEMSWVALLYYLVPATVAALAFQTAAHIVYPVRYRHEELFKSSCLAGGICPVCEYRLQGLTAPSDGCVQCPECAACWKVESIGDVA